MSSAQRLEQARSLTTLVREMAREIILPRYLRAVRVGVSCGGSASSSSAASLAFASLPNVVTRRIARVRFDVRSQRDSATAPMSATP